MNEAKEIIAQMPDNCPKCLSPVKHDPGLINKNRYYCEKCDRHYGKEQLTKAAQCPNCFVWIKLKPELLEYECPQCKRELKLFPEGFMEKTISVNESDQIEEDKVIFKSKEKKFSDHTVIHPGAGIELLVVRGNNIRVPNPDEKFPFRQDGKALETDAEIYYVRSVFPGIIPCGTVDPIHIFDQHGVSYDLQAAATLSLRINDPVRFFKWAGYRECAVDDLVAGAGSAEPLILDQKIMTCFPEALAQAVQAAQKSTGKDMETLSRVDIGNVLRECLTSGLFEIGMSCDNVVLENFSAKPGKDLLMDRVERKIQWDSEPITVHEKDNPEFNAKIIMHGEGRIHIRDRIRLRRTALGQEWAKEQTPDDLAERTLSEEAGRIVHAAFNDILQPMIDDTGIRLGSIERFLNYMQNNIQTYLNNSDTMDSMGLEITGLSMKLAKNGYQPCNALVVRDGASARMATIREEEGMRKFMEDVQFRQEDDASKMRIRRKELEAEEAKQGYEHLKTIDDINEQMKDRAKGNRIREIDRSAEIESAEYKAAKEMSERRQKEEDEQRERRKNAELAEIDYSYEVWLRQRRQMRAIADATRTDEIGEKEHEIHLLSMDEEAARGSLLADEKTKEAVHDIMQRIQESDLELRKKLDAYAYLQKLTEQKDQADLWEHTERTKADIQKLLKKNDLEDAQGRAALFEQAENNRAEREEKALQAEYVRDMELRRMALSHELDKMNHESEMMKLAAEAEAREKDRAERLELLETNFAHIETLESQNTDRTAIQAELDKVRAICDYLKTDSMARATQAANEQERLRKAAEDGESNLTKIAGKVEDLHKQLGEMMKVNGDEYQKGLQEVRNLIGAEARDQKFEDMFREMRHAIELIRDRAQQVENINGAQAKAAPIVQNIYQHPVDLNKKS